MLASLELIYHRLIQNTDMSVQRYLYKGFVLQDRLTGLIGARGVGKTTLLLQYIREHFPNLNQAFYVSADHIYFERETLYAFIENLYLTRGITTFFIDEIHKYPRWNQELKNLYDGFPDIYIVFSGSSSLDLIKGSYDLSRRAKIYRLPGLSFREYLNIHDNQSIDPISLETLCADPMVYNQLLPSLKMIQGHFQTYLQQGFYPFINDNPLSYYEKLLRIVDKTIYEDIANFYRLKTENLHLFKKILQFMVSIPPGKLSIHNLAKNVQIDDKTMMNYLSMLHETHLIRFVFPDGQGHQLLRKAEKMFIDNTSLHYALLGYVNRPIDVGSMRELFTLQSLETAGYPVFYTDIGDFQVKHWTFEIGGKNKTKQQIKDQKNAFLIKDNLLFAAPQEIPLYYLGFLY